MRLLLCFLHVGEHLFVGNLCIYQVFSSEAGLFVESTLKRLFRFLLFDLLLQLGAPCLLKVNVESHLRKLVCGFDIFTSSHVLLLLMQL